MRSSPGSSRSTASTDISDGDLAKLGGFAIEELPGETGGSWIDTEPGESTRRMVVAVVACDAETIERLEEQAQQLGLEPEHRAYVRAKYSFGELRSAMASVQQLMRNPEAPVGSMRLDVHKNRVEVAVFDMSETAVNDVRSAVDDPEILIITDDVMFSTQMPLPSDMP